MFIGNIVSLDLPLDSLTLSSFILNSIYTDYCALLEHQTVFCTILCLDMKTVFAALSEQEIIERITHQLV